MRSGRPLAGTSLVLCALVGVALSAAGFVGVDVGVGGGRGGADANIAVLRAQLRSFGEYRLFDAGDHVEGWPLTAIVRRGDTAAFVSFVYGDCTATDDVGCAPPVEIQVWPSCRRSLALYGGPRPGAPAPERTHVRGVPAAFFDGGTRLELQTGRSSIVVFGDARARLLRVAAALRSLDGAVGPREPLPAPAVSAPGGEGGAMGC